MNYIFFLVLLHALPHYSLTTDPVQLAYLYDNLEEDIEIPALISTDSLVLEGTLSIRGGASLYLPKKSWHIRICENNPPDCSGNILLNAQSLDPSFMRNTLGHLLTRELGYPAPITEFVTLSLNGSSMGIYERIERIDREFFQRNGLGWGPIFKSIEPLGRIVCQYSDRSGIHGLEPKRDSDPYRLELLELIENCFAGDVSSLETEEFIALFAVNTAIANRDGIVKNIFLHRFCNRWHVYPWDRDASFGNSPGEYIPGWEESVYMGDIGRFGAGRPLLELQENIVLFNDLMEVSAEIMALQFPHIIDSLRIELRSEIANDPYYEFSPVQFDSICAVLSHDIEARASFLPGVYLADPASRIGNFLIGDCLNMGNQVQMELELLGGDSHGVMLLFSIDRGDEFSCFLPEEPGGAYSYTLNVPHGAYSVQVVFGPRIKPCFLPVYYPSWSFMGNRIRPVPAPGARIALAPLRPEFLLPGTPVWCGENLWVLPVSNTADFSQDLSLCSFRTYPVPGTVFLPESVVVAPEETFYLTNNSGLAENLFPGRVFGDAGSPCPVNCSLFLCDPSWHEMSSWMITDTDTLSLPDLCIIPTEICRAGEHDWIELFNAGDNPAELSGFYLIDSERNASFLSDGLTLQPGEYLVVCENPEGYCHGIEAEILEMSLNRETDSLWLYDSLGKLVFALNWTEFWPGYESGIMYLKSPVFPVSSPFSWASAEPPGTPGLPNPGWSQPSGLTRLRLVSENPCSGAFSLSYETSSETAQLILYDICGRVISELPLPASCEGTLSADFSGTLPSGLYIVSLRSGSGWDSACLTILRDDQ